MHRGHLLANVSWPLIGRRIDLRFRSLPIHAKHCLASWQLAPAPPCSSHG
jgi:hypothetical protein